MELHITTVPILPQGETGNSKPQELVNTEPHSLKQQTLNNIATYYNILQYPHFHKEELIILKGYVRNKTAGCAAS